MSSIVRTVFRHEALPARALWWLAADGMASWLRMLRHGLGQSLGGKVAAERAIAKGCALAYTRRYDVLRAAHPELPDAAQGPRAVGLVMGALARTHRNPGAAFALAGVGGAPRGLVEHALGARAIRRLTPRERWEEVAAHLGEVLIGLTRTLPAELPQANAILGRLCFDGGVRYGERAKRAFGLPDTPDSAIEVLRMGEYIFRVNPEHWGKGDTEANTGYLEGTACPWWSAPGWGGMHCGIFGQFQSGISSVFGLRYHLSKTIPKHGGHTCRIDLRPITPVPLRASRDGAALSG